MTKRLITNLYIITVVIVNKLTFIITINHISLLIINTLVRGNNQLPRVDLFKDLEIIFFKLIFIYEIPDKPSVQTVHFTRGPGIKYRYQSANLAYT